MEHNIENIKNLFNQQDKNNNNLRRTMVFSIFVSLIISLFSIGSLFFFYFRSSNNIFVMDKSGNIASAFKKDIDGEKSVEIDNHVRMIYNTFFSYSPSNYKKQVELGLDLTGEKGRLLYQTYNGQGWFNTVVQNNLTVSSMVDSIKIDAYTYPYKFKSYGKQFVRRFDFVEQRNLILEGELYDQPRVMEKNPHGLEANFIIVDNRTTKSDSIVSKN